MSEDSVRERIIQVATRLFTEIGYDGTTGRMIADSAGVDTGTLMELTGGTLELYSTVMHRAHLAEAAMLEEAAASLTPTVQGVREFADTYLDFHLSHPHIARLWLHRWLGDAAGSADLESRYERPLTDLAADALRPMVPAGVDLDYMLWTLVWVMTGFVTYGVPDQDEPVLWRGTTPLPHGHRSSLTPQVVARFRAHMHMLIDRVLGVPSPPPA